MAGVDNNLRREEEGETLLKRSTEAVVQPAGPGQESKELVWGWAPDTSHVGMHYYAKCMVWVSCIHSCSVTVN